MTSCTYNTNKFVMGTLACPLCGFLLPLTTSRTQPSQCPHCSTFIEPSTTSAEAAIDIRELLAVQEQLETAVGDECTLGKATGNDIRVVEEAFCEKCNTFRPCHTYARQIRGADEGQTIFFECTVCKSEWSLNS